jgi:hypothetical protein
VRSGARMRGGETVKDDDAMQALKWLVESILRREVPLREGQKVACLTIVSRATELRQLFHTDDPAGVK